MKNFMLFLMTLFLSCHVMAQQTTVTGTITDGNCECFYQSGSYKYSS